MKPVNYTQLEVELQNRWRWHYRWYRKQNDEWDKLSNFIYNTQTWKSLINQIKIKIRENNLDKRQFFNYAANRWYNFWHAVAIEQSFCEAKGVKANKNSKDKFVDFYINTIPFDHKTSVFPKTYNNTLEEAKQDEDALIRWLYSQQSSQQRQHFKNRLFVIVYNTSGAHWKLKANVIWLQDIIKEFMCNFKPEEQAQIRLNNGVKVYSAIVWAVK